MKLTREKVRNYILSYQNLLSPYNLNGKKGVLDYIKKVGCIQFDPLNMVGTNPNLVLQSRINRYKETLLYDLLYKDRLLIDDWDKNMSIYLVSDWPYFSRYRRDAYERYNRSRFSINEILPKVRETILKKGPVSSKEFQFDKKVDWYWAQTKVSRAALESMYFCGELIIHHKEGNRKYYDYTKKHLSSEIISKADPNTNIKDYHKWHLKRRIGAIGMLWNRSSDAYLGIHYMKGNERTEALKSLIKTGDLIECCVEGIKYPFLIRKEDFKLLESVDKGIDFESKVSFLAPLDNMLWDRKMIKEIFGFEYTWEVYKPKQERKYGYYVLPVLYGNEFIARVEPKFYKKTKELKILNWWWEDNINITKTLIDDIKKALNIFMNYLGAEFITGEDKLKI